MQCRASRAEDSSFVKERMQAPLADTGLSRSRQQQLCLPFSL